MYIYIILQYDLYMCNLLHTFYFLKKVENEKFYVYQYIQLSHSIYDLINYFDI